MILRKLTVGPYASNCYIIGSEATKDGMIIDPGANAPEIIRTVEKLGLKIALIVLTHRHPDHVGAAAQVKAATKAPLASHAECAKYLPQSPSYLFEEPFEGAPKPEKILADGDIIDIGDLHFKVLHTPGHTPCGISLYGEGHVFTGDTLFNYGIGRYDLIDGDYNALIKGIKTKLLTLPPETVVHPGHGPDSTIATEIRANTFLR
ncbi:MAG: MBL fold metallo-hydrolase [Dehalococcoidales bacterium]|jgi:glyoxylase-like metal-dependent hydrolase (beta-lactamase superfamily II)